MRAVAMSALGQKADIGEGATDVRFIPKSGAHAHALRWRQAVETSPRNNNSSSHPLATNGPPTQIPAALVGRGTRRVQMRRDRSVREVRHSQAHTEGRERDIFT